MKILVINCGSSSLKYQLIDMDNESVVAKGLCERIGIEGSKLTHKATGKDDYVVERCRLMLLRSRWLWKPCRIRLTA